MVKILATLFMVIDHFGLVFLPQSTIFRILGRISMPLFAFAVAQGFYYSSKKSTTTKYARNLLIFSVVSQIPYTVLSIAVMGEFRLNIGFTWLLAVCFMNALRTRKKPIELGFMCLLIFLIALVLPIDYGLCGVLYPFMLYFCLIEKNEPYNALVGVAVMYAIHSLTGGTHIQFFSVFALPLILLLRKYKTKIELPKGFYYWFYPLHITFLLIIKHFVWKGI